MSSLTMTSFMLDILSVSTLACSVFVITAHSPVVAILYLITVFVLAACYLMLLGAPFIGLSYLIVYVGAVAVLFLFVVMMLNVRLSEIVSVGGEYTKGLPLGFLVGTLFLFEVLSILPAVSAHAGELGLTILSQANAAFVGVADVPMSTSDVHLAFTAPAADESFVDVTQVQALGLSLYTYGAFWLILVSILLLLAMMGPIALCMRTSGAKRTLGSPTTSSP